MKGYFQDRTKAGIQLADELKEYEGTDAVVLAIPLGGVPVGYEVAKSLKARFDLIIPRKLPVPWNPEAGFGAVTAEGAVVLNRSMIEPLGLEEGQINAIVEEVRNEVRRREKEFRNEHPKPDLKEKTVLIVDDGIASGYTMLAAVTSVKQLMPRQIVVAVPVAASRSAQMIAPAVDKLVVLVESHHLPFAVTDYYLNWHDLDDQEVKQYLSLP